MRFFGLLCGAFVLAACAGRAPAPVQTVQFQDNVMTCEAITAEIGSNTQRIGALGSEQGAKVAQNVAAGVAGVFIPVLWFGMDFQGAAGIEQRALESRNQYLATLASQRCSQVNRTGASAPVMVPTSNNAATPVAFTSSSQTSVPVSPPLRPSMPVSQQTSTPICPPAGTRWATSSWSVVSGGADPASPTICIGTTGNGTTHRLIYNFFATGNVSDESIVQGMAPLFPLAIGRKAEFISVQRTVRFEEFQYNENFQVTSEELITVGSERRDTWVVRRIHQGLGNNTARVEERYWIDKETGVWLRRVMLDVQGISSNRGYTVTSLTRNL